MRKCLLVAAAALVNSAGMAASADYYLKIEGISQPSAAGPIYLKVVSTGDLDGDGVLDQGVVRLSCAAGKVSAAHFHYNVKSPRDAASGQASGRRGGGITHIDDWSTASRQLSELRPAYDIKKVEGAKLASDGWHMISLAGAEGLCPAALSAAQAVINTSRSNIKGQ